MAGLADEFERQDRDVVCLLHAARASAARRQPRVKATTVRNRMTTIIAIATTETMRPGSRSGSTR